MMPVQTCFHFLSKIAYLHAKIYRNSRLSRFDAKPTSSLGPPGASIDRRRNRLDFDDSITLLIFPLMD